MITAEDIGTVNYVELETNLEEDVTIDAEGLDHDLYVKDSSDKNVEIKGSDNGVIAQFEKVSSGNKKIIGDKGAVTATNLSIDSIMEVTLGEGSGSVITASESDDVDVENVTSEKPALLIMTEGGNVTGYLPEKASFKIGIDDIGDKFLKGEIEFDDSSFDINPDEDGGRVTTDNTDGVYSFTYDDGKTKIYTVSIDEYAEVGSSDSTVDQNLLVVDGATVNIGLGNDNVYIKDVSDDENEDENFTAVVVSDEIIVDISDTKTANIFGFNDGFNSNADILKTNQKLDRGNISGNDWSITINNLSLNFEDQARSNYLEIKVDSTDDSDETNYSLIGKNATYAVSSETSLRADIYMGIGTLPSGGKVDFSNVSGDLYADLDNTTTSKKQAFYEIDGVFFYDTVEYHPAFYNIANIKGGSGNNTLIASDDFDSTIQAGIGGNNVLYGSDESNDLLIGTTGERNKKQNTFHASLGEDTIQGFDFGVSDTNDVIDLEASYLDIAGGSYSNIGEVKIENGNLIVEFITGTAGLSPEYDDTKSGNIIIEGAEDKAIRALYGWTDVYVDSSLGYKKQEWKVKFASESLTYEEGVEFYSQIGGDNDATLNVSNTSAEIYLNNWTGAEGSPVFWGIKELSAVGNNGNVSLAGANSTDNVIRGGSGDNKLWGGFGGDDTINAGTGTNELFYLKGDGNDEFNNLKSGDTVNLLNISLSDLNLNETEVSGSKLAAKFNDSDDVLTINGDINSVEFKLSGMTFRRNDDGSWSANNRR